MHQELSFGKLDRRAVDGFMAMCAKEHIKQTRGRPWRGNPYGLKGSQLLKLLLSKRFKAASAPSLKEDLQDVIVPFGIENNIEGFERFASQDNGRLIFQHLGQFLESLSAKQVSDSTAVNLRTLQESPTAAWCVIVGATNTNFTEKSDCYTASLAIISAACGIRIQDPLRDYKRKFSGGSLPTGPDGSLDFSPSDLDLKALNHNNQILKACWRTLIPMTGWQDGLLYRNLADGLNSAPVDPGPQYIPNSMRPISSPPPSVDLKAMPPGAATLGLGPVKKKQFRNGMLRVGGFFGFTDLDEDEGTFNLNGIHHGDCGELPLDQVGQVFDSNSFTLEFLGKGAHGG